jgi:hypothetical protein
MIAAVLVPGLRQSQEQKTKNSNMDAGWLRDVDK